MDRLLRTGPDLDISPFSPVPEKNAKLEITGQKFTFAPVSFFLNFC
jgi:hypothetical protein